MAPVFAVSDRRAIKHHSHIQNRQNCIYTYIYIYIVISTVVTGIWWGNPRERGHWGDLQEVGGGCADWMDLAQDRERWQALVSAVINFRFP